MKQPRAFGSIHRKLSKQLTNSESDDQVHEQHGTYSSHELNFIPLELNSGKLSSACMLMYE